MARKKPCKLLFYIERGGIRERKGVRAWFETPERGRKILHLPPDAQVQCGDVLFHKPQSGALSYEGWFPVIGVEVDKKEVRAECLLGRSTASILRFGHYHQHYNWGGEEKGFGLLFVCGSPAVHKELSPITYHWDTDRFSGEAEFLMCPCDIRVDDVIHYQYLRLDPPTKEQWHSRLFSYTSKEFKYRVDEISESEYEGFIKVRGSAENRSLQGWIKGTWEDFKDLNEEVCKV